ncbi:MAG: 2-hydroxychromene-2-carboxylate isomerase [Kofleriaceae bacterium]|nr:2-hydroxychromene-2-carboxylate isomerase [Kofleriaceae bacterium]
MRVEFWFDFSCPYAYLASTQIEAVCRRAGATLELCPMLLGGVFRAIGAGDGPMSTQSLTRTRYTATDVARWAAQGEVALAWPARHPQRTVLALRAMLGLPPAWWATAMHALFAAYWRDRRDPTEPAELRAALTAAGVPATLVDAALAGAEAPAIKDALRARTDAAVARGVFGAPAMVVDDGRRQPLLWGQDRMHLVEAALAGWWPDDDTPGPPPAVTRPPARRGRGQIDQLDFYFDVASPFAYLGATQIEAVGAAVGAPVRWIPILLGALFREVGTPDVPLLGFPEPKRRYVGRDLGHWARWWQVPLVFPRRFPQRSVTAQRLILAAAAAGADAPALARRLFRAFWAEDRSIEEPSELGAVLAELALPAGLLEQATTPAIKDQLRANTDAARTAGVFGVPTTVAHHDGTTSLFWGQDRLDLLAGGWW